MNEKLTLDEQKTLLHLAREALELGVRGKKLPKIDPSKLTNTLRENGATFVTLTINTELRGCIGTIQAYQPLAEDVREHAVAAALEDPRFARVEEDELRQIHIEVSRLTRPVPLEYLNTDDLLSKLRPNVDGVILSDGLHRAVFLPEVWEKLPSHKEFLDHLCYKMGVSPGLWRMKHLDVSVFQAEAFHEG